MLLQIATYCQETELKYMKNWELKGYGKDAERKGDLYSAITYFKEYLSRKPGDLHYTYLLAHLYRKARDYSNAKITYIKVYQLRPQKYRDALFYYAVMLKNLGNYDDALTQFTLFEKKTKKDKTNKSKLRSEISGCRLALKQKDTLVTTIVMHLDTSVNKAHIEFSPLILNDSTIVYGSSNMENQEYYSTEEKTSTPYRKFFMAKMNKDSSWLRINTLPSPFINFSDSHTGNGVFSLDKKRFYYIRCSENWKYKVICNMCVSEFKDSVWQPPIVLSTSINDSKFTTTQPAVGNCYINNLEVIYFSSDRPGGMGEYDIWYSVYDSQKKEYTKAVNAGFYINTPGDEITPFYDLESHSLYFSSNGWPCFGGFDVFRSFGDLVNWSQPENIGYPVNSSFDDMYYSLAPNHQYGYFTSNRDGSIPLTNENCCDDIYYFKQTKGEYISVHGKLKPDDITKEIKKEIVAGKDSPITENILGSVVVTLSLLDNKSEPILLAKDTINKQGEFSFIVVKNKDYKITIENDRVVDNSFTFNSSNSGDSILKLGSISVKIIPDHPVVINDIYYEFDKSELTKESKAYLDSILVNFIKKYPYMKIEMRSHTDNVGTDEYNMILSQKRAESVVNFLVEKGISRERLTATGYGSKFPVAKNSNDDGTDNPEGRKQNRRTEFKIIGKTIFSEFINK